MSVNLAEFILARIVEDEAVAVANGPVRSWVPELDEAGWRVTAAQGRLIVADTFQMRGREGAEHIARHDPGRVLAECEAKRRYLTEVHGIVSDGTCGACSDTYCVTPWDGLCEARKYLALPYADHPDYREEWKP